MAVDYTVINGYKVPLTHADMFRHGDDNSPLTDEEWDEQVRRIRKYEPDFRVPKVED